MEELNSLSALIQALTAIAALVLSIIVALQSKRIKELEDIVKKLTDIVTELKSQTLELKNHTIELGKQSATNEKQLLLQKTLTLRERFPYFEKSNFQSAPSQYLYILTVYNTGKAAHNISVVQEDPSLKEFFDATVNTENVENGEWLNIHVRYKIPEVYLIYHFRFSLNFLNHNGYKSSQHIAQIKDNGDFVVLEPSDYL